MSDIKPIFGELIRAGTFVTGNEEVTGLLIEMTREELTAVERLPMYRKVAVVVEDDVWTVRADDYDRLAKAAGELHAYCKDRLPPGYYAQLDDKCRAVDAILNPKP